MITVTMVENLNERYIASVRGLDSSGRSYWPHGAILFFFFLSPHWMLLSRLMVQKWLREKKGQLGICLIVTEIEVIEDKDINGMEAL